MLTFKMFSLQFFAMNRSIINQMIKNCAKRHIRPLYVNFRGDIFFVFGLVLSVAQLSSASFYFLCFPAAALSTLTHDVTPIVLWKWTIFCLVYFRVWHSTAQPFIIFLVFLRYSRYCH